ncbi:MAG: permease [Candidatus Margulisiibacteriota bacterium]|jgi:hypothetical protein
MWQNTVDFLLYSVLRLNQTSAVSHIINFVIYDFFKLLFMVAIIMGIISFIKTFIPKDKLQQVMTTKTFGINYFAAALFGVITPFCSCSSIPIFMGFIRAGVPIGVAFTFLITSPLVNEVLIVLMFSFYGFWITFFYVCAGMILGIVSGFIISLLQLEDQFTDSFLVSCDNSNDSDKMIFRNLLDRFNYTFIEVKKLLKSIYLYIFIGVFLGGILHNFVPKETLLKISGGKSFWAVPLAVLIGVPIYAGCSTVAPMIFSITSQGVPLGTSLALLMAIAGLSLPEALILKSALKLKLLLIFYGIVTVGIIIVGYLFNIFT